MILPYTVVSLVGGLAVFALIFGVGIDPGAGVQLAFIALPVAFSQFVAGGLFAFLFFTMLAVMTLTSLIAFAEPAIAYLTESFHLARKRASRLVCLAGWLLGLVTVFSFNILSDIRLFGGLDLFSVLDNLASNIMVPVGGLLIAIYVGYSLDRKTLQEQLGFSPSMQNGLVFLLRIVAPVTIVVALASTWLL